MIDRWWFISSRGEVNIVEDIGVDVYTVATWIGLAFPSRECLSMVSSTLVASDNILC